MSDLEQEFNKFLVEVEALSIHHGETNAADLATEVGAAAEIIVGAQVIGGCCDDENRATAAVDVTAANAKPNGHKNLRRKEKEIVIKNAAHNQRAWSEFTKLDLKNDESNLTDDGSRPKISFKLQNGKSKLKKKGNRSKLVEKKENGIRSVGTVKQSINAKHESSNSVTDGNASSEEQYPKLLSYQALCPSWKLVIDTSSLVNDNGFEVQRLMDLASHIALKRYEWQRQNPSIRQYSASNAIEEEPIQIIIPYKVWSELEYQSKSDNSDLAYSARTVMRMLRDELQQGSNQGDDLSKIAPGRVIHSQTLVESQNAAKKFVMHEGTPNPTNDDQIVACALIEQEKCATEANSLAGGVVMITSDNNMACKALSNGLKVYTPAAFRAYYLERIDSLRQRGSTR
jgi:hypothetical protein